MSLLNEVTFRVPETMSTEIGEIKRNQKVSLIVDYEVIETTKSFTVLRVNTVFPKVSRRKF